jgi:glycosyltransferase involved in cell wall biosynthesis
LIARGRKRRAIVAASGHTRKTDSLQSLPLPEARGLQVKILFLIRRLGYGGAERQLVALASALRESGHSVCVAVFYPCGPLEEDLTAAGVPVCSLDKSGRWDALGFMWRLIKLVRRERPDIVHGYLSVSNILTALIAAVFPRVAVAWGVRSSNMHLADYDWLARILYRVECHLAKFADLIIVNSRAGFDYAAANGFPKDKMLVIPNGIDTERFRPDSQARRRVRAEWNIKDDEELVGLVARLDPMKDHSTFLKAAALLSAERERAVFVCVGDGSGPYKEMLAQLGAQLGLTGRLIWAGARRDMPAIYNALDVAVSSSSYGEGFSNVIGEAMACDVPCVVTDVGDSALIVSRGGEVVPPRDAEALKTAIAKCLVRLRLDEQPEPCRRQHIISTFSMKELEVRAEAALLRLSEGATC